MRLTIESGEDPGCRNEVRFRSPSIQAPLLVEEVEDAILYPAKQVGLVIVLSLEDETLGEVLDCADEQPMFDEKVARILLGDAHHVRHEIGDKLEKMVKYENAPRPAAR